MSHYWNALAMTLRYKWKKHISRTKERFTLTPSFLMFRIPRTCTHWIKLFDFLHKFKQLCLTLFFESGIKTDEMKCPSSSSPQFFVAQIILCSRCSFYSFDPFICGFALARFLLLILTREAFLRDASDLLDTLCMVRY